MNAKFFGSSLCARRRWPVVAAIAVLLCIAGNASASAAGDIHIALHPKAEVGAGDVLLSAVADVSGGDLPTVARLRQLRLGAIAQIGAAALLTRKDIEYWMRTQMGVAPARIVWDGSETVDVTAQGQTILVGDFSALAREALTAWLKKTAGNVSVAETPVKQELIVPRGPVDYRIRPFPENAVAARKMTVWVEIWSGESFVKAVPVGFEVSVFKKIWVAKNRMNAGSRLQADDCELKDVDITAVADPAILREAGDVAVTNEGGMRVRRTIEAGGVLSRANTEIFPTITRGETATLHLNAGTVRLESRVEVLEDGFTGQTIHVKNSGSVHQILARIVGPGAVEVQ